VLFRSPQNPKTPYTLCKRVDIIIKERIRCLHQAMRAEWVSTQTHISLVNSRVGTTMLG